MRRLREKEWPSGDPRLPRPPCHSATLGIPAGICENTATRGCITHARAFSGRSVLRFPSEFIDIVAPFRVLFVPFLLPEHDTLEKME